MNEVERIANQVYRAYLDGFWGGGSIRELFRSLAASEAAAHPISDAHSAWDIALHLAVWHDIFRGRIEGEAVDSQHETDWPAPAVATDADWGAALDELDWTHRALVSAVRDLKPEELDKLVPGKTFTVYEMLHGVAQHDLYHAGQVMMIKKAIQGG
jgi:uncharacterized damage-inducible protein DinB